MADEVPDGVLQDQANTKAGGTCAQPKASEATLSVLTAEMASKFRASCMQECADLFQICAKLPGPVRPLPTPRIRSLSDVTLKTVRCRGAFLKCGNEPFASHGSQRLSYNCAGRALHRRAVSKLRIACKSDLWGAFG